MSSGQQLERETTSQGMSGFDCSDMQNQKKGSNP